MLKIAVLAVLLVVGSLSFAQSAEQKRWVLALTGIMSTANRSSLDTLEDDPLTPGNAAKWKHILERDWNIHNRDELLATIEKMTSDGHESEFQLCRKIASETTDYGFFNMTNTYELTQKQYNYLKYFVANSKVLKGHSILVWDLGRNVALCRWGYDSGFLTEAEAWQKMFALARRIQPLYTSWKDYGFDYYMGRVFWASGFGNELEYAYKTDPIYRSLISDGGDWNRLDWNIDLGS